MRSTTPITFGAWARLVNFKANHRKVIIADDGRRRSHGHRRFGQPTRCQQRPFQRGHACHGPGAADAAAERDGGRPLLRLARHYQLPTQRRAAASPETDQRHLRRRKWHECRVITEGGILATLLERIDAAGQGDNIDIAMFYLADRARRRSAAGSEPPRRRDPAHPGSQQGCLRSPEVRHPEQPVASELVSASDGKIHVRWYRTHGEQFHTKLVMIYGPRALMADTGLCEPHAPQPRRLQSGGQPGDRGRPQLGRWRQQPGLFRDAVEQPGLAGNRVHGRLRGLRRPGARSQYWLYRLMEVTGLSTF